MDPNHELILWRVFGATVRGASHIRTGMPNQDAIQWTGDGGSGTAMALAVSDGHGSAKCFRSDTGAKFAVKVAINVLLNFHQRPGDPVRYSERKRLAEENLPKEMVRSWRKEVDDHWNTHGFSEEELNSLLEKDGPKAREAVESNKFLAYGATLLCVLVTQQYALYVQLGDGDILEVSEDQQVQYALPTDERLFANETTSLCGHDAWSNFRIGFQVFSGSPPSLILLSTDGYSNSFQDTTGFLKVGSDLLDIIRTSGIQHVKDNLEDWLREASEDGSGDDVTLGMLYREENHKKDHAESSGAETSPTTTTELEEHRI